MKSISLKIGVLGLVLLGLTHVNAQEEDQKRKRPPSPEMVIEHLDTNDDHQINMEEAQAAKRGKLVEHFEEIDTNTNGQLSLDELKANLKKRRMHREREKRSR